MRSQYSSGGGDNTNNKACIVLYCINHLEAPGSKVCGRECYIFIIDDLKSDVPGRVDADGFTSVSPIHIDYGVSRVPVTDAFCVLGETLYMFEGCVDLVGEALEKSVFAIDLALTQTLTQETRKLKKGDPVLKKIADMTFPKKAPVALPTPDGTKIVVFPTRPILSHKGDVNEPPPRCVFELFEPAKRSWEPLPSITGSCDFIEAYGFIQGSNKFLVQVYSRMYVIDLSGNKEWLVRDVIYENVERIPNPTQRASFFETIGESSQFCFVNGVGFYDLEEFVGKYDRHDVDWQGFDSSPLDLFFSERPRFGDIMMDSRVARLNYDRERGECRFCHMIMPRPSNYHADFCEVAVIVCSVDLKSYKEMSEQLPLEGRRLSYKLKREKTTIVKTRKFKFSFGGKRQLWEPHLFFAFQ